MTDRRNPPVALVSGASRGLGAAMARALADAGWSVAVNYSTDDKGAGRVVDAIIGSNGRATLARFDVTDETAVSTGMADIARAFGLVELIVNNATGPQPLLPIERQTWNHHLDQLRFFIKAPLLLLQSVLEDWRRRRVGRIVNIGSEVVDIGNPQFGHYVAAKAAMVGLTRSWARELGHDGINVNLIAPGFVPVSAIATTIRECLRTTDNWSPYKKSESPKTSRRWWSTLPRAAPISSLGKLSQSMVVAR